MLSIIVCVGSNGSHSLLVMWGFEPTLSVSWSTIPCSVRVKE